MRIFMFFSALILLAGCSNSTKPVTGPFVAKLSWIDGNGKTVFSDVKIETIKNLENLESDILDFQMDPEIIVGVSSESASLTQIKSTQFIKLADHDSVINSAVNKKLIKLEGRKPKIDYTIDNQGLVIPRNRKSMEILTTYAHLEKLFIFAEANGFPKQSKMKVAFFNGEAKMIYKYNVGGEEGEFESVLENNAAYVSLGDFFLFMSYNLEKLPLTVNGGVIGHEYFHRLFAQSLQKNQACKPNESVELYIEKKGGLNEGLADYFGMMYSNDFNLINKSLNDPARDYKKFKSDFYKTNLCTDSEIQVQTQLFKDSYEKCLAAVKSKYRVKEECKDYRETQIKIDNGTYQCYEVHAIGANFTSHLVTRNREKVFSFGKGSFAEQLDRMQNKLSCNSTLEEIYNEFSN